MKGQYCSLYLFDTVRTCCSPLYEITSSNHDVSCLRKHDLVVDGAWRYESGSMGSKGFRESFEAVHYLYLILSKPQPVRYLFKLMSSPSPSHHALETAFVSAPSMTLPSKLLSSSVCCHSNIPSWWGRSPNRSLVCKRCAWQHGSRILHIESWTATPAALPYH